jgi:hypothetical protein
MKGCYPKNLFTLTIIHPIKNIDLKETVNIYVDTGHGALPNYANTALQKKNKVLPKVKTFISTLASAIRRLDVNALKLFLHH